MSDEERSYCLFETALGVCGVAWRPRGLTRVQLPEGDPAATARRLRRAPGGEEERPPADWVADAIARVQASLSGVRVDLRAVAVDLCDCPPFHRRVYEAARDIAWGETTSYGELARRLAAPGAARAVGQALARNPLALVVPCHRVLAARGRAGGFSAFGGLALKARLLALEGVELPVQRE